MTLDAGFAGSIPAIYHQCLVPVLFAPFAEDLVARAVQAAPRIVLELAAGTGVVSHALSAAMPDTQIVATDLNQPMLDVAARHPTRPNLRFQAADAQALPFDDNAFDLVVAQFGAMFFPDKVAAFREARRVLDPSGIFMFTVWDRLSANTGSAAIQQALRDVVPDPKPEFIARTPFGYNDPEQIEQDVRAAGFVRFTIERVERTKPPGSAARLARGMCLGSPVANELAVHPPDVRARALSAAIAAVERAEARGPLRMTALVVACSATPSRAAARHD
jgi:ubiquinone/menaquinone biosynthesis C-methylase UbiE